jgi:protoheme IX farnesyltransferase
MKRTAFFRLALAVCLLVFMTMVLGGIVRAMGAGTTSASSGCPDWPACYGSLVPPSSTGALIDYAHRAASFFLAPALLVLAILAASAENRRFRGPVFAAIGIGALQSLLGGWIALTGEADARWLAAAHLGLSLGIMALTVTVTVAAWFETGTRLRFRSPFSRLTLLVIGMMFLLLVSGALVSASGSEQTCSSWPLCGTLVPANPAEWINTIHRAIVGITGILMVLMLARAWKTQRTQTTVLAAATASFVLFFSQSLMGWFMVAQGYPAYTVVLHEATSAAVWGALIVQAAAVGMANRTREDEQLEAASITGRKGLLKDFLMLTKPIVVLLLLVTTFTGMVIGAQAWPSLSLVFWTLLGGAMAAGGSGAINQYIDRFDDIRMQRTQKRPIPSGRMTPGEGLAWGIALCISSFFLLVAFVNLLAALLSLAGIIYYVLLYSIFLKKASVQNIVIGGGAGAIPPLVGWAAATGQLNIPSLFLFAVIFMWTPPHFWALAIVRKNDYARAGVPMLPVVKGEVEARRQILIYTIELVVLTLALPLFGLGQAIYLVSALVLGLWLLMAAVKLWKQEGNKVAWKMYRYSSMYLAFLFVALMVDRLILH